MSSVGALDYGSFQHVVFFTGAGISVESGIPTYRGAGGVWKDYNYQEYACEAAFRRHPEKVWDFHDRRRALIKSCAPNSGHCLRSSASEALSRLFPGHAAAGGEKSV